MRLFADAKLTGWRELREVCIAKLSNEAERDLVRKHNHAVFGDDVGPTRDYFENISPAYEDVDRTILAAFAKGNSFEDVEALRAARTGPYPESIDELTKATLYFNSAGEFRWISSHREDSIEVVVQNFPDQFLYRIVVGSREAEFNNWPATWTREPPEGLHGKLDTP